tara:strand:+ start:2328 stop:5351 length:3024 start_codon:yes stop_codon:yes gene_type:complete
MGNIFDSPITMGVIAGTLDVVAAGRVALREEQKKKAAAAQESAADAQKQLVEFLGKPENYGSAAAYMNTNHHSFLALEPDLRELIFLNATRTDQPLPPDQKAFFDMTMDNRGMAVKVNELMGTVLPAIESYEKLAGRDFTADDLPQLATQGITVLPEDIDMMTTLVKMPQTYITMMRAAGVTRKLNSNELSIVNDLPTDAKARKSTARELLPTAKPGTMFHTILSNAASATLPAKPYESLSADKRETIQKLFLTPNGEFREDIKDDALSMVDTLIENIQNNHLTSRVVGEGDEQKTIYEGSPDAIFDLTFLNSLRDTYGTQIGTLKAESDLNDIITLVQNGADRLKDIDGDNFSERKQLATNVLATLGLQIGEADLKDQDTDTPGFQVSKKIPPEAAPAFLTLVGARDAIEQVAKDEYRFNAGTKSIVIDTGDSIQKNPESFIADLNTRLGSLQFNTLPENTSKAEAFYLEMDDEQKQVFEQQVLQALRKDDQIQNTAVISGETGKEAKGSRDYSFFTPELYSLPFVQAFLHDELNLPRPDQTFSGRPTNPTPQVGRDGSPLSEDEYAFNSATIMGVTPAVKELAARAGMTTHDFFNKSDLHYRMIETSGARDPFRLFEPALVISNMGFFQNRVDASIGTEEAAKIGQVFARFGITDRGQQLDILSIAMSDNIPEGLGAEPGRTTVNLAQSNTLFEALTGVPLDEKKLNSRMAADRAFLRTGNQVLDALRKASDGSAFTQDVRATFMNLFTVSDSVASQAVKAGKKAFEKLGIYNPNDYVSVESRERIEAATEQFLQQEFLANDAVLASSLVKFAYSFAKTMDEAGRISERDYIAALAAVNADFLATKNTRLAVVENLIQQSNDAVTRHNRLFDIRVRLRNQQRFINPTRSQIKQLRVLRYFDDVVNATRGLEDVERFKKAYAAKGFSSAIAAMNDTNFTKKYSIKIANGTFGQLASRQGQEVYRVKAIKLGSKDGVDFINGVPMFIGNDGKLLSQERINELLRAMP